MEIIKIAVLILTALIISNGIPTLSKEISVMIAFGCCTVVLLYIIDIAVPAVEYVKGIAKNIEFEGADIVLKAVGIGFITQFVSDTALDCNNKALANQMVFAGRVCMLVIAVPVFMEILKIIEFLT